jgi:hypothetical protein
VLRSRIIFLLLRLKIWSEWGITCYIFCYLLIPNHVYSLVTAPAPPRRCGSGSAKLLGIRIRSDPTSLPNSVKVSGSGSDHTESVLYLSEKVNFSLEYFPCFGFAPYLGTLAFLVITVLPVNTEAFFENFLSLHISSVIFGINFKT